nr:RNA N6-adenosine-methyltransferase METTL16-like [Cherax quadricarinatus]
MQHTMTLSTYVLAIDIGVGAACVYPLLGAKRFGWCFVGTESDQLSFTSAHTNVQNNNLQDKIFLKKVESNIIFKDVIGEEKVKSWTLECKLRSKVDIAECSKKCAECEPQASQLNPQNEVNFDEGQVKAEIKKTEECSTYLYDFTMCNPPFFSCEEETDTMKKSKKDRGEPLSAPTGAIHEKVTEGGEISFITKMIEESQLFKDKIRLSSIISTADQQQHTARPQHRSTAQHPARPSITARPQTTHRHISARRSISARHTATARPSNSSTLQHHLSTATQQ